MRYRFRLEPILRLRELQEEEAQKKLLRIRQEREAIEQELELLKHERKEAIRKRNEAIEKGEIENIETWRLYILGLENKINKTTLKLQRKLAEEEKAREEFLERRKEKKSLLKLKEKKKREFIKELDTQERKTIDEVAERKHRWK